MFNRVGSRVYDMEVSKIFLFPFKSLKGITVDECEVDEHGFLNDRLYMLAYKKGPDEWIPITQRGVPALARISTQIKGNELILEFEGDKVSLPLDVTKFGDDLPTIQMSLWDFPMQCKNIIDAVPNLNNFFTKFFKAVGSKYHDNIGVVASDKRRVVPQEYVEREVTSSFQDIWPGTLMTTASFEDLERHVRFTDENASIQMESFRMNLLIETDEPWIEDDWKELRIGEEEWIVLMNCERCSMPAVDQVKGETRKGRHPLPSLNKFRILEKGRTPCFGLNILNKRSGYKVKVGDAVTVVS